MLDLTSETQKLELQINWNPLTSEERRNAKEQIAMALSLHNTRWQ